MVQAEPLPCTVHGGRYSTAFDCTAARAMAWRDDTHTAATIELDGGIYETRIGLQMPADGGAPISIIGKGKGEFLGGTTLRLVAPLQTGVISYPYLDPALNSGYWSNLHLSGFTVDAQGKAPQCLDLYALRVAHLSDLSCTAATGQRTWMRVGGYGADIGGTVPSGRQGLAFQVMASDIFVYNNGAGPGATVQPRTNRGALESFDIQEPGLYRELATAPVFLKGATAGEQACTTMPTGLVGHLVSDPAHPGMRKLARVTFATPGAGCGSNLRVTIPDMPAAEYGLELAATDSTFYDLAVDSVGTTGGITDRGSDGSVFYHPHAWNVRDMFDAWGHDSIVDPEIDSVYGYGIRVRYGESTTITRPAFIYLKHPAYDSVGDFFFDPSTRNTLIDGPSCLGVNPNRGYAQLATFAGAFLPGYGQTAPSNDLNAVWRTAMPPGFQLLHNRSCVVRKSLEPGVTADVEAESLLSHELRFSASNQSRQTTTPFLLAVLSGNDEGTFLRATLEEGKIGDMPRERVMLLKGVRNFAFRAVGSAGEADSSPASVRLLAYRQPNGNVSLYAALGAQSTAVIKLDMVRSATTLLMPEPEQRAPEGTLLFDSGAPGMQGLRR